MFKKCHVVTFSCDKFNISLAFCFKTEDSQLFCLHKLQYKIACVWEECEGAQVRAYLEVGVLQLFLSLTVQELHQLQLLGSKV